MSEKNVHETQWTKSAATAQKQNYDTSTSSVIAGYGGGSNPAVASLYGSGATLGLATNIPPHPPDPHSHSHSLHLQSPYGNVRLQQPPQTILHHVGAAPSHPPLTTGTAPAPHSVLLPTGASAVSNVPVSTGGFVPPHFTTTSSTPIGTTLSAAATSVLTPNPFAVHHHSGSSNVGLSLEQFQQQFEFTKMMTAMNTAAAVSLASSSTHSIVPSTSTAAAAVATSLGGRQHMELTNASGAITTTIAENVINAISVHSPTITGGVYNQNRTGVGVKIPDEDKMRRIQNVVETGIGDHAKQQIVQILDRISTLKPMEKLFLYLRMPGEAPETDPLRQPQNPLGTRSEINHTINWVRSHLEHDPQVSIPKQDVYNEYITYCDGLAIKPLSTADFGKVMKQVFPEIRPRRLGTRGHSRYCYAAMRKTTKLNPPQLPQLGSSFALKTEDESSGSFNSGMSFSDNDHESWEIIKLWAENMLNVKVENMKSLATYLKNNNLSYSGNNNVNLHGAQKKLPQRETKDKRSIGDMGPLKKRRKKKRKGSSSSESSYNQSQRQQHTENINKVLSPANMNYTQSSIGMVSGDEQKPVQLIEVKQEKLDSPNFQRVEHIASPKSQAASLTSCYSDEKQQQHQQLYQQKNHLLKHNVQQLLPMNLATETRTVLTRAPPTTVVGNSMSSTCPIISGTSTAVKNLTSKIMDLSTAAPATAFVSATTEQLPIKEEIVDDYNPNILCKKVRKAQQTKQSLNYWSNSPTPSGICGGNNIPITIVTAASPPIVTASPSTALPSATVGAAAAVTSTENETSYLMGPPAQITTNTSTSPSASTLEGGNSNATTSVPKVASRNMLQLRAKKLRYYQIRESMTSSSASPGSDPHPGENTGELGVDRDTADLPENLGLPRERVISICNMDKHELDDYFLPGEEENSQEQEAELLQYFQTGDAEENRNSSDAAKSSNPTATHLPISSNNKKLRSNLSETTNQQRNVGQKPLIKELPAPQPNIVGMNGKSIADTALKNVYAIADVTTTTSNITTSTSPAVGSASASLALMSQKHQQQQQNQQQIKRKINLNAMPMGKINATTTRKNCIFLPISPNINNTASFASNANATNGGGSIFASPGLTRFRPKPALSKQQSLDCDTSSNSDPMIGASRRRKSAYGVNTTVTSASAPPSPSVLQQQQLFAVQQTLNNPWQLSNTNAFNDMPIVDQNSLDLDLFDAATAGNSFGHDAIAIDSTVDCTLAPLSETQRSQSVPLSQLQRRHSPTFNRSFQTNFSTCTSVAQTPVPSEFADFNMFSENSQQSQLVSNNSNHAIKIEDVAGVISSDTAAILNEVDVSDILPDFVAKFSSVAHSAAATATACSSAGSSSGYSSGACTTFSSANIMGGSSGGGGIISRSVPSTPLPHHQHNLFENNTFYGRRRAIDEMHLSPTAAGSANLLCGGSGVGNVNNSLRLKYGNNIQSLRTNYDISKSMPTTPITTPCFRYSPIEYRDYLSNGNTLDSITSLSTVNVIGNDSFISGSSNVGMDALNTDALIDDSVGFSTEAFTTSTDTDTIMVGPDILGNL